MPFIKYFPLFVRIKEYHRILCLLKRMNGKNGIRILHRNPITYRLPRIGRNVKYEFKSFFHSPCMQKDLLLLLQENMQKSFVSHLLYVIKIIILSFRNFFLSTGEAPYHGITTFHRRQSTFSEQHIHLHIWLLTDHLHVRWIRQRRDMWTR